MTLHKLTAGDGYAYLTRQVAAHDSTEVGPKGLSDYYSQKGERPGRWLGSGTASLGVAGEVSAEQMSALFGEGRHPDATELETAAVAAGASPEQAMSATRLGRPFPVYGEAEQTAQFRARVATAVGEWNEQAGRPRSGKVDDGTYAQLRTRAAREMFAEHYLRPPADGRELDGFIKRCSRPERAATAGFDLTFSPVKSVSVLWAVAPRVISEQIEAAHDAAVAQTIGWLEDNVIYTREGTDGVRQVDVRGLVAVAFTHRDSRAGDPDLHTHVPIANKVQTLDGRWLALDGQAIYKANVAASELYNTAVGTELRHRLGVRFADAPQRAGKRPIREIEGVDAALSARWSSRAGMIEARRSQLARQFLQDHGRPPAPVEQYALGQRANLETRAAKHQARSLAEQRAQWRDEAIRALGADGLAAMLAAVGATPGRFASGAELTEEQLEATAAAVVASISASRSVWQAIHIAAEAQRQARALSLAPEAVADAVERITARALQAGSVPLTDPDAIAVPDGLRRRDGQSQYTRHGSQLFTSDAVLAAEAAVMAAAGQGGGFAVEPGDVDLALLECAANGLELNAAQAALVRAMATSGARCQLALAPAGTGKTTAMQALATALRSGGGQVLGLAPSAVACGELAAALGASADTIDLLRYHLSGMAPYAGGLDLSDAAEGRRPEWMRAIGAATVVVVDEAGMASTSNLHAVIDYVTAKGGSVRLIGDDRQLASVAAGGLLRDIKATHGALDLRDPVRFTDPAEGLASLAIRQGDESGLAYALDNNRVHVGDAGTVADAIYAGWSTDVAAGADSLMLAPFRDQVAALNTRARDDRLAAAHSAGDTRPGRSVNLLDGCRASRGDTVITRRNDRRLTLGRSDFVANGDRWTVLEAHRGGRLTVRHHLTHRTITLPAEYVAAHVQLGYATTVHGAQGVTVGSRTTRGTVHAAIDPGMSREQLYVAMTRGTDANHLHVIVVGDGGEHSIIRPETISPATGGEILGRILTREEAQTSATTTRTALADPRRRLQHATAKYAEDLHAAAAAVLGADRLDRLQQDAETAVAGITAWPAWPAVRGRLALIAADGRNPIAELTAAAEARDLRAAGDPAAVLDWRLAPSGQHSASAPGPVRWLPPVPAALAEDPMWGQYLRLRSEQVTDAAGATAALARSWTAATAPVWARPLMAAGAHPKIVADLGVWRAATGVEDADRRLAGPPRPRIAERFYQRELTASAQAFITDHAAAGQSWTALAESIGPHLTADPYWPLLAGRLDLAHRAGVDIGPLLRAVAAIRPLPDEQPAAALWWRLARHLSAGDTADAPVVSMTRPAWSQALDHVLGEDEAVALMTDPIWPALAARVAAAEQAGMNPTRMVLDIADTLTGPTAAGILAGDDLATALVWRISLLTDPIHHPDGEPDPDTLPPPDLHALTDLVLRPAPAADVDWTVGGGDDQDPADQNAAGEANPFHADWPADLAPPAALGEWRADELVLADLPHAGLDPAARVEAIGTEIADLRAELAACQDAIAHRRGAHELAATPLILSLRARADRLQPLLADRAWAYTQWIHADTDAETAASELDSARRDLQVAYRGVDDGAITAAAARAAAAEARAAEPIALATELFQSLTAAHTALTDAAGSEGVITNTEVDRIGATARDLDDGAVTDLRGRIEGLGYALGRAEASAARAGAAGIPVAALTGPEAITRRWEHLAIGIGGTAILAHPAWPHLATAIDKAATAGIDVDAVLPVLATPTIAAGDAAELRRAVLRRVPEAGGPANPLGMRSNQARETGLGSSDSTPETSQVASLSTDRSRRPER